MVSGYKLWRLVIGGGVVMANSFVGLAQHAPVADLSHTWIERGNKAWIKGMKTGDVKLIAATYAEDALDCAGTGECFKGRSEIYEHLNQRFARLGPAQSATVTSGGSVRQGDFVYEWGVAQASFANGKSVQGHYLTVWQLQADRSWRIFRNIAIPDNRKR